jgi:hypothetical protein
MIPEPVAISSYWQDAHPIEEALLHRQEASITVTKHSHGLHHSQCFGRVVLHMLLEAQFAIKIEAQVPPIGLGFQWVALGIRLIAEVE